MPSEATTRDDTRHRLVEAALEVFLEKGYAEARVQEIAARAGFTTGAIYSNFNGKAGLFAEAIETAGLQAMEPVVQTLRDGGKGVAFNYIEALGQTGLSQPFHVLMLDALAASSRDHDVRAAVFERLVSMRADVASSIESLRARGGVDENLSTEALVAVGEALVIGAAVRRAIGVEPPPLEESLRVLERIWQSFAPADDRPDPS